MIWMERDSAKIERLSFLAAARSSSYAAVGATTAAAIATLSAAEVNRDRPRHIEFRGHQGES